MQSLNYARKWVVTKSAAKCAVAVSIQTIEKRTSRYTASLSHAECYLAHVVAYSIVLMRAAAYFRGRYSP